MTSYSLTANHQSDRQTDKVIRSTEALAKQYRSLNPVRLPVGGNLELVYSMDSRSGRVLPRHQAGLLDRCREFRTLDEHAWEIYYESRGKRDQTGAILADPSAPIQVESIKRRLAGLVEAGFLVSDVDLLERCGRSAMWEEAPPRIASVGVVTQNRPESLKRCLESYIENVKRHGRENDFVVMDDSESAEARAETRRMLRDLRERYEVDISYAGLEEKLRFAEELIRESDIPPEVVRFALFDVEECCRSTGANRNALLLHTAGDLVISADDDTVCQVGAVHGTEGGLALHSKVEDFIKSWFYPNHESALQSVVVGDEDALTSHERLLGKTIGECVSAHSEFAEIEIGRMSSRLLKGMQRGGRVVVTLPGVVGDSGMSSPAGCLLLEADSRERMVESESAYQSAWVSREMLRAANRLTISDSPWLIATALGLDNRSLLPPFMPVYRNQDGLFGLTLQTCFDDAYFGHLPHTILHAPAEDRLYGADAVWKSATRFRFCDVLTACVMSFDVRTAGRDEGERLRALGKHLTKLGTLALSDFEELARLQTWRIKSGHIVALESLLTMYKGKPDYWASDVRRYVGVLREALLKEDYIIPQDVSEGLESGAARRRTQRLIYGFGRLLYCWPEIVDAAKRLRARNHRLAAAV